MTGFVARRRAASAGGGVLKRRTMSTKVNQREDGCKAAIDRVPCAASAGGRRPRMEPHPKPRRRHRETQKFRNVRRGPDALDVEVLVEHRKQGPHFEKR